MIAKPVFKSIRTDKFDNEHYSVCNEHGVIALGISSEAEADEIAQALNDGERMRQENERLKTALKPFATIRLFEGDEHNNGEPDSLGLYIGIEESHVQDPELTFGDFRRAADALEAGK